MNFSIQQSELEKQKSPNDHEAIRNPDFFKKIRAKLFLDLPLCFLKMTSGLQHDLKNIPKSINKILNPFFFKDL